MHNRRKFLRFLGLGGIAMMSKPLQAAKVGKQPMNSGNPVVVSTWYHGLAANAKAWSVLNEKRSALDAVEAGVMVTEADIKNTTVGIGGTPDRDGCVTLDACIMNAKGGCGAVAFLQHIKHPVAVARKVMEETPHVMLVGEGALEFALSQGFEKEELLTPEAQKRWEEWKKKSAYTTPVNRENHDTIGMLALDHEGNISGACTTSGMGYKMHGRVGDSPIIGAGLYVDNEIGAAVATGLGELVMQSCGSFLVVELMRQGYSPEEACKTAIDRIVKHTPDIQKKQVGLIALRKDGTYGACSIHKGFDFAVTQKDIHKMNKAVHKFPK